MNILDNSLCHCHEKDKIKLKNFDFDLFCCNCKYNINCCNIKSTLTQLIQRNTCKFCNKNLNKNDINRCKLYLNINNVINYSSNYENNYSFLLSYNNLYVEIFDFSFMFCFNNIQLNFQTINNLKCNEIIEKFIHKNIYIWFEENYRYFLNIY